MLVCAGPEPERRDDHAARMGTPGRDREADLRSPERDGRRRAHRRARHLARRGIDPRRNVDGDDGASDRIDALDHARGILPRRLTQADAEQRVHDHIRIAEVTDALDEGHLPPGLAQHAGADLAVAAVLALAADDGDATRELPQHGLGDRGSSALHQLLQRALVRLLRRPRLVGGQERLQPHSSTTTATAAASSRECVIESSIRPAPIFSAHAAVRPLRWIPGLGRPRTSISFQVK